MPHLKCQGRDIISRDGENVLDTFLRHGISIPFSCRSGICHTCLQRCVQGTIPDEAQRGLRPELRKQGFFLPCKCIPLTDMEFTPPTELYTTVMVQEHEELAHNWFKLLLEPTSTFVYHAGQFINVRRPDGLTRSYSLASVPSEDFYLEIHLRRESEDGMSSWLLDESNSGDGLKIQGGNGDFYYKNEARDHPLLLVGSEIGMAALTGIVRDALHHQHKKAIHLHLIKYATEPFYLHEELRKLEQQHGNFYYHESVSNKPLLPEATFADYIQTALQRHEDLRGWHVYLAVPPEVLDNSASLAAVLGATPEAIHSNNVPLPHDEQPVATLEAVPANNHNAKYPPTDLELWAALQSGTLLTAVLTDFYDRVFQDERLSSFFDGLTKQRLIEKQFLFTRQILTGEKIYFGDRPRNSHHWMVISNELFDYRKKIMMRCLHEHGLPAPMVQRYDQLEEFYRADIVKDTPFPRVMGDVELPLDGFDELIMDVGTLCDSCERAVSAGEKITYHVRLGKVYCSDCGMRQK